MFLVLLWVCWIHTGQTESLSTTGINKNKERKKSFYYNRWFDSQRGQGYFWACPVRILKDTCTRVHSTKIHKIMTTKWNGISNLLRIFCAPRNYAPRSLVVACKIAEVSVGSKWFCLDQLDVGFITVTHWMPGQSRYCDPVRQFLDIELERNKA